MIICSCNVIRERDIRDAARKGHPCAVSAYRSMGCEFQCGGCEDHADHIIAEEKALGVAANKTAA
ncbi:(2Fe-2S)-binding protein [Sphingomicrobium lutaoense]|uniref:Bacterioferritin-associated ferredoxin n=1 Tax=Sphingomicrobium lutaoense TaxID=515949 RepID=A0A839YVX9_9SPHN|nr:(2Fe-2S)-binding protein [Sphingomicrobium lutaoense]MBB3764371.1 bacterioferritin-associated ferredoxin [Sphingomicrobium lutaoense]